MVASSVFETMFSLPQPADAAQQSVIHVSEDSRTLEYLLRFCYPLVDNPVFDDLSKLEVVLESAMKYEATEACASLRRALQNLLPLNPLHAYAIACRLNLEEEAKLAATKWGKIARSLHESNTTDFSRTIAGASYLPEMARISAGMYYRFLSYLRTRRNILFCQPPIQSANGAPISGQPEVQDSVTHIPPFNLPDADLVIRSIDNVDFRVHRTTFVMAGGEDLLARSVQDMEEITLDGTPVVRMDAIQDVVTELLRVCYSLDIAHPVFQSGNVHMFRRVVETATTHGLTAVVLAARSFWKTSLPNDPLSMYLVAANPNWDEETKAALQYLSSLQPPAFVHSLRYTAELEQVSASVYHELLKQRHKRPEGGQTFLIFRHCVLFVE